MQAAKVKVKDMVSTAKEKMIEHRAKSEEKLETKAAFTNREKEMAHEMCKTKIAEAKAQVYKEKAEHRLQAHAHAHGDSSHVMVKTPIVKYPDSSAYSD